MGIVQDPLNHNSILAASKKTLTRIQKLLVNASRICQGHLQSDTKDSLLLEELFSCTIDQNGNTTRIKKADLTTKFSPCEGASFSSPGLPKYGFLTRLSANPYLSLEQMVDRAASNIHDIFEKIMTFVISKERMCCGGVVAREFKCTPVTPPAWQFLGKRVMNEYISRIPYKNQEYFNNTFKEMMKIRRVRFRHLRQKDERKFFCYVSLREDFCIEVTFEPCSEDGIGFARHVSNYLSSSLGPWLYELS